MPTLLTRRAAVLFKLESTKGVDALPLPATDGVLVEQPRITFNANIIEADEVTTSMDPFEPVLGGISATIEFNCCLKGTTISKAPEWGKMLVACGFQETVQAAVGPQALAAGASTTQCTLGAAASAVADTYRGMPIIFTGTVATTGTIWDYSAAKLAKITETASANLTTSTNYTIPATYMYMPTSPLVPPATATIYIYNDGVLYKFTGCRGTCPLTITSGGEGSISFRFVGLLTTKTDAVLPAVTYDGTRPPVWKAGAFTINAVDAAGNSLSIDPGNNLTLPDNPALSEGFDIPFIMGRQCRGTINPKETLVATRNIMADFRGQVKRPIYARLGITTFNRIAVTVPNALYLNETPTDTSGYTTVDVPFHAAGQDASYMISVY